jgi:hypothetical protein
MKYLLLICGDEKAWATMPDADRQQLMADFRQFSSDIQSSGQYVSGSQLQPTASATSVRVRDGKRLVTDGPFAETREQLGGFYIVNVKNLDEAIALAARIPSARTGTVEVRPLIEMSVPAAASA